MPSKYIALEMKQRTRFEYEFFINDGAKPPNAVNIIGRTFKSQMRETAAGPLIAEFTLTPKDQTSSDGKGRVIMSLMGIVTQKIPAGVYLYDVFQTVAGQEPEEMFHGTITVQAAITR